VEVEEEKKEASIFSTMTFQRFTWAVVLAHLLPLIKRNAA
jgi:hypothetical protein